MDSLPVRCLWGVATLKDAGVASGNSSRAPLPNRRSSRRIHQPGDVPVFPVAAADDESNCREQGVAPSRSAASRHHEAGIAFAAQHRYAEAVKEYLEAARLNPNDSQTFYNFLSRVWRTKRVESSNKSVQASHRAGSRDWRVMQSWCGLRQLATIREDYSSVIQVRGGIEPARNDAVRQHCTTAGD